jgi:anthranilate phosphoribosyltransferase
MIREGIQKLIEGADLTFEESGQIMHEVMSGKATNSQTAAFLTALRMKGEAVDELISFASVMKSKCHQIHPKIHGRLVDTCGTGGDKIKTFNVSTAAAFVIAGAGIPVAKHGNRAVTSRCGSADLLELFGLNLNLEPKAIEAVIEKVGIGFLYAPAFHPAMKYASEPRREIGIRTVFNILGPLTNPACANAQLLGVYDEKLVEPMAHALGKLDCEQAMVVHGLDGIDEISTLGKTAIAYLNNGAVTKSVLSPEDLGLKKASIYELNTSSIEESAETVFRILSGIDIEGAKVDIVLANSAAGIIVGGKAFDFETAIQIARESILSGAAYGKLKALVKASCGSVEKLEELEVKYA